MVQITLVQPHNCDTGVEHDAILQKAPTLKGKFNVLDLQILYLRGIADIFTYLFKDSDEINGSSEHPFAENIFYFSVVPV
jgi:hypothetical protein